MASLDSPELKARIGKAKELISVAERELEVAMKELQASEPNQKTMITTVLREAFDKLEIARRNLEAVIKKGER
jgi:hypothetical protein